MGGDEPVEQQPPRAPRSHRRRKRATIKGTGKLKRLRALRRFEAAQKAGDLDAAKKVVEMT